MTQTEALLLLSRVLVVFLIALCCVLCIYFPRREFFRWWTGAWVAFGLHLAFAAIAVATQQERFFVAQTLAGYAQSPLLIIGARRYERQEPKSWTRTVVVGIVLALVAGLFFHWWSSQYSGAQIMTVRHVPRKLLLAAALGYFAWVCIRHWRITHAWSALVNAAALGIGCVSELSSAVAWAAQHHSLPLSPAILYAANAINAYELPLGLAWPLLLSLGMILLLLEENKRTEEVEPAPGRARERLESNFAEALRACPDGISIIDLKDDRYRYVEANDAFLRLIGYSREEVIGRTSLEVNLWEDASEREASLAVVQERGTLENTEMRLRRKNGEILTLIISMELFECEGGLSVLTVAKDITERKAAEQALRVSEQRFSTAFHATPEPMAIVSREDWRLVEVNDSFLELSGYSRDELLGRGIQELRLLADANNLNALREELEKSGLVRNQELRMCTRFGRELVAQVSADMIELEGRPCLLATFRDITENKRAADALRLSEARFRDLFENASDVIFSIDLNGLFTSINKAGERIIGYSRNELIGTHISRILAAKDLHWVDVLIKRALNGEVAGTAELEVIVKDGRTRILELSEEVIAEEGVPVGIEVIARDITERKDLVDQQIQAQKMEAIGRFAGGIAHDFNNLLSVIMGYSDLLSIDFPPGTPEGDRIREICKASERAASLSQQLLAFSRKQVLQSRVLDINEVIADMQEMLGRLIGEHITPVVQLDPGPLTVKVDPSQIQQVVMNLVLNARDAMPHGGVLTIQTSTAVRVSSEGPAPNGSRDYVLLRVADTGLGMNAETQARIFEPFFTTKDPSKGTGLGMPTVYGIVNQSGGKISVHSQLGSGTAFDVYLPLVQEEPQPAEESIIAQPAYPQGVETVLLIEDEAAVRQCVRTWLEQWGFTVLCAESGEEALEVQARHEGPIHLVLTDVVLPGARGPEVAKRIAELRSDMRVIYMSGYADTAVQYLEKTTNFVRKPIRMSELAAKVRMVLDNPMPQPGP